VHARTRRRAGPEHLLVEGFRPLRRLSGSVSVTTHVRKLVVASAVMPSTRKASKLDATKADAATTNGGGKNIF
jgi:hypothetical protein